MGNGVKVIKIVMLSCTNVRKMQRSDQELLSKLDTSTFAHRNMLSVQPESLRKSLNPSLFQFFQCG